MFYSTPPQFEPQLTTPIDTLPDEISQPIIPKDLNTSPVSDKKSSTKIACIYCNKLHKKCDGDGEPCSRCVKKGQPCVYATPQKRGPKSQIQQTKQKRRRKQNPSENVASSSASHSSSSPQQSISPSASQSVIQNYSSPQNSNLLTPLLPSNFHPTTILSTEQKQDQIPFQHSKENTDETQLLQYLANTVQHFQQKFSSPQSSVTTTPQLSPVQLELDKIQQHLNLSDSKMRIIQLFLTNVDCFSVVTIPLVKQFVTSSQSNIHQFILLENSQLSLEDTPIPLESSSNIQAIQYSREEIELIRRSQLLLYFAILAKSLQKLGNYERATEYFEKAKILASKLLIIIDTKPNAYVCTALLILAVHAIGLGDALKANLFTSIGLHFAETLRDPIMMNVASALFLCMQLTKTLVQTGYLSLNAIALQNKVNTESPSTQYNQILNQPPCHCECTASLPIETSNLFYSSLEKWFQTIERFVEIKQVPIEIVDVGIFAILTKYVVDIATCKKKATETNQSVNLNLLAQVNSKLDMISTFVEASPLLQTTYYKNLLTLHKFLLYSVRGLISAEIGMDQLTKYYVESAMALTKSVQSNLWPPIVMFFIPLLIICSAQLNDNQLFSQTVAILNQFRKIYPISNYATDTVSQKFNGLIVQ